MMSCFRNLMSRVKEVIPSILWMTSTVFVVWTSELARIPWAYVKSLQVPSKTNELDIKASIELVDTQIPVIVFKTLLLMKSMKMRWLFTKVKWKPFRPNSRNSLKMSLSLKERRLASLKLLTNSRLREKRSLKSRSMIFKMNLSTVLLKIHIKPCTNDEI